MSRKPKGWLTTQHTTADGRIGQYVDTLMLRLKVKLWHRRWRRIKRRFLSGWMSRG